MISKRYRAKGEYNAICDRCGFKFAAHQCKLEWTGLFVCKWCYEEKHPLEIPQNIKPETSVPKIARPYQEQIMLCTVEGSTGIVGYAVVGCSVVGKDDSYYLGL